MGHVTQNWSVFLMYINWFYWSHNQSVWLFCRSTAVIPSNVNEMGRIKGSGRDIIDFSWTTRRKPRRFTQVSRCTGRGSNSSPEYKSRVLPLKQPLSLVFFFFRWVSNAVGQWCTVMSCLQYHFSVCPTCSDKTTFRKLYVAWWRLMCRLSWCKRMCLY